jgi:NAD(P)-dependent dehydrogenase (short-subunit alcohol dehydrogenase family)
VTGGSRGLGLGLVEALVAHGARVAVVARESEALESVHSRLGVAVIPADVTDDVAAKRILAEVRPDIVVLNAGAGFHRNLGDRRQGRPLLDPGGAQSAAQAGKPRPRRIERRGRERIAALGRLRRRQAHALVYG